MKAFIYTRTAPNERSVAKSDRRLAQERRCLQIIKDYAFKWVRTYSDEGHNSLSNKLPALRALLNEAQQIDEPFAFVVDHPARIANDDQVQRHITKCITALRGNIIYPELSKSQPSLTTTIVQK